MTEGGKGSRGAREHLCSLSFQYLCKGEEGFVLSQDSLQVVFRRPWQDSNLQPTDSKSGALSN